MSEFKLKTQDLGLPKKGEYMINPTTKRKIKIGGRTWKKLVKEGSISGNMEDDNVLYRIKESDTDVDIVNKMKELKKSTGGGYFPQRVGDKSRIVKRRMTGLKKYNKPVKNSMLDSIRLRNIIDKMTSGDYKGKTIAEIADAVCEEYNYISDDEDDGFNTDRTMEFGMGVESEIESDDEGFSMEYNDESEDEENVKDSYRDLQTDDEDEDFSKGFQTNKKNFGKGFLDELDDSDTDFDADNYYDDDGKNIREFEEPKTSEEIYIEEKPAYDSFREMDEAEKNATK